MSEYGKGYSKIDKHINKQTKHIYNCIRYTTKTYTTKIQYNTKVYAKVRDRTSHDHALT